MYKVILLNSYSEVFKIYFLTVWIDQKTVTQTKLYLKLQCAFEIYDKNSGNVMESIISNGRGFQNLRGLQSPIYVISELQALSCGQEQDIVDKMDLVYLPKKLLQQKVILMV